MSKMCPKCRIIVDETEMFCPDCGTGVIIVKKGKSVLNKKIYDYLIKEFNEVYAVGHKNVDGINIYDERNPPQGQKRSRWIKESTSLVLKDKMPFLSVEMMINEPSPITVAGNVLIHSIADSAIVKFKDSKDDEEHILANRNYPRFLLIVIPEPSEDSDKWIQIPLIEQLIKELSFLEKSSLKNFKICFANEFESVAEKLLLDYK
jgi:hypothetical protein